MSKPTWNKNSYNLFKLRGDVSFNKFHTPLYKLHSHSLCTICIYLYTHSHTHTHVSKCLYIHKFIDIQKSGWSCRNNAAIAIAITIIRIRIARPSKYITEIVSKLIVPHLSMYWCVCVRLCVIYENLWEAIQFIYLVFLWNSLLMVTRCLLVKH